jgi:hypothetical protein
VRDVEAQTLRRDERALLGHMRTQNLAQRLVNEMRGGVVRAQARAPRMVDLELDRRADLHRTRGNHALVHEEAVGLLQRIGDIDREPLARNRARVAHLAAGLAVKRSLVDDQRNRLAGFGCVGFAAIAHDRLDHALGLLSVVAEEFRRAQPLTQRKPDRLRSCLARACPALARLGALALHGVVEPVKIDRDAALAQRVLRKVEREAIRVVKLEGGLAVEHVALAERVACFG